MCRYLSLREVYLDHMTSTKLTGQALINHVDNGELNGMSKTEQCLTAGYVRDNGKAAYTEFYTELLNAKGTLSLQDSCVEDDEGWYNNLSEQQQELYDAIEEGCPEFQKLSTDDCDTFMSELEDVGITTANEFSDAYYGQQDGWNAEAVFTEELCLELAPANVEDTPYWFAINWQKVWDHSLSYDFSTIEFDGATYFFRNN
jgi:hypothetical protein